MNTKHRQQKSANLASLFETLSVFATVFKYGNNSATIFNSQVAFRHLLPNFFSLVKELHSKDMTGGKPYASYGDGGDIAVL